MEVAASVAAADHVVVVDSAAAVAVVAAAVAVVAVAAEAAVVAVAGGRHETIPNINSRACKGEEDDASGNER